MEETEAFKPLLTSLGELQITTTALQAERKAKYTPKETNPVAYECNIDYEHSRSSAARLCRSDKSQ